MPSGVFRARAGTGPIEVSVTDRSRSRARPRRDRRLAEQICGIHKIVVPAILLAPVRSCRAVLAVPWPSCPSRVELPEVR